MNSSKLIILANDDPAMSTLLEHCLIQEGFFVVVSSDGRYTIELTRKYLPDLILLDTALPDWGGWEVCRSIRRESTVPIIMLAGRDNDIDHISGLELGADACLSKPVNCRELLIQIQSIFRRIIFARSGQNAQIKIGNVRLDTAAYKVFKQNQSLPLRQKEFELLYTLMARAGHVLSRAELLDKVWGVDWLGDTRTLDVHIRWVREKIEETPGQPRYIQTVRGVGYRFASPDELVQ